MNRSMGSSPRRRRAEMSDQPSFARRHAARDNARAEKRPFQRRIPVHPAAAEPGGFSGGI